MTEEGGAANEPAKQRGIPIPGWAVVIAGAILGVGLIVTTVFDVADRLRPRFCDHLGIWCQEEGEENDCEDDPFDDCDRGGGGTD